MVKKVQDLSISAGGLVSKRDVGNCESAKDVLVRIILVKHKIVSSQSV